MTQLLLLKSHPEVQALHIYEHLYLTSLANLFEEHNLLSRIDYSWHGKTFYSGNTIIEISLNNEEAEKLEKEVTILEPSFDIKIIVSAIREINAEKQNEIGADPERLMVTLKSIQSLPWEIRPKFDPVDDDNGQSTTDNAAWDSDVKSAKTTLSVKLSCQSGLLTKPAYDPVVKAIQDIVLDNLSIELRKHQFYFFDEESSIENNQTIVSTSHYTHWPIDEPPEIESVDNIIGKIESKLTKPQALKRLNHYINLYSKPIIDDFQAILNVSSKAKPEITEINVADLENVFNSISLDYDYATDS